MAAAMALHVAALAGPAQATAPALVIDGGTYVTSLRGTQLVLQGDLLAAGTFSPGPGSTLVLAGYGSPTLMGTPTLASLLLALHGTASLAQSTALSESRFLASGWLSLGGHDLIVPILAGGSAASYVVTPDTLGRLARPVGAGSDVFFAVGNSHYDPVALRTATGTDNFRVAVLDAVPPQGIPAGSGLSRAWAISQSSPHSTGLTYSSIQWNASEQGPQFDRTFVHPMSAVAYRWLGGAWVAQRGVRRTDNDLDPAVDSLFIPDVGLWTLGGPSGFTAVDRAGPTGPATLRLAPPEPHPVRGEGVVRYGLPREAEVSLTLYDVTGARRLVLADGRAAAGWHTARLDASRMPEGVYFLRLTSGRDVRTARCVVLR
jgi:hypothetical protein